MAPGIDTVSGAKTWMSGATVVYENWVEGEPGGAPKDGVVLNGYYQLQWKVKSGKGAKGYICEMAATLS